MYLSLLLIVADVSLWGLPKGKKKIILLQPPLKAEVQEILGFPEQTWSQAEQSRFWIWKTPDFKPVSLKIQSHCALIRLEGFLYASSEKLCDPLDKQGHSERKDFTACSSHQLCFSGRDYQASCPQPLNPGLPGVSGEEAERVWDVSELTSDLWHEGDRGTQPCGTCFLQTLVLWWNVTLVLRKRRRLPGLTLQQAGLLPFLWHKQQAGERLAKAFILTRDFKGPNEERNVTGTCWNDK